jgi:hypothetical protein
MITTFKHNTGITHYLTKIPYYSPKGHQHLVDFFNIIKHFWGVLGSCMRVFNVFASGLFLLMTTKLDVKCQRDSPVPTSIPAL